MTWFLLVVAGATSGCRDPIPSSGAPEASSVAKPNIAPLVTALGLPMVPSGARSEPDPHWAAVPDAKVELDETFLLELGMGSGLDGLNVTTIAASGRASHVYAREAGPKQREWRRVEFRVTPGELGTLVRLLNEERFLGLPLSYGTPDVHDGAQWLVHVRTRARDKYVYLDNVFPEPVVRVARFVSEELIGGRGDLGRLSQPYDLSRGEHLWRWFQWYKGCDPNLNPVEHDDGCMPLAVGVRLRWESGVPAAARYDVVLVDRSAADRAVVRESGVFDGADVWLTIPYDRVDFRHRYEVEARVTAAGRSWVGRPKAVLSYGEPYGVVVELGEVADGG